VALLDADSDGANLRFADEVETVRSGYILARDPKQYNRWRRDVDSRSGRKPGRNLAQLAHHFGGSVVAGDFEFRES
jgi:hypothetical protein